MTLVMYAPPAKAVTIQPNSFDTQRSQRVTVISPMQAMDVPLPKPSVALSAVVKNYVLAPERRMLPGLETLN